MWNLILIAIIFILFLFEALFALPLILIFIISLATLDDIKISAFISFFAGLVLDISHIKPLGLTSLFFLGISLIIILYQRKFREENIAFLAIVTFIFSQVYYYLYVGGKTLFLFEGVVSVILSIISASVLYNLKPKN